MTELSDTGEKPRSDLEKQIKAHQEELQRLTELKDESDRKRSRDVDEELKRQGFFLLSNSEVDTYNTFKTIAEILQEKGFGVKILPEAFYHDGKKLDDHVAIYGRLEDTPADPEGKKSIANHPVFKISSSPLIEALSVARIGMTMGVDIDPEARDFRSRFRARSIILVREELDKLGEDEITEELRRKILSLAYSHLITEIQNEANEAQKDVTYEEIRRRRRDKNLMRFKELLPQLQGEQISQGLNDPLTPDELRGLCEQEVDKYTHTHPEFKSLS